LITVIGSPVLGMWVERGRLSKTVGNHATFVTCNLRYRHFRFGQGNRKSGNALYGSSCLKSPHGSSLDLVDTDVLRSRSQSTGDRYQGRVQALMAVVPEITSELGAEFSFGQEPVQGLESWKKYG
jgi:hypothetical protein